MRLLDGEPVWQEVLEVRATLGPAVMERHRTCSESPLKAAKAATPSASFVDDLLSEAISARNVPQGLGKVRERVPHDELVSGWIASQALICGVHLQGNDPNPYLAKSPGNAVHAPG